MPKITSFSLKNRKNRTALGGTLSLAAAGSPHKKCPSFRPNFAPENVLGDAVTFPTPSALYVWLAGYSVISW